MNFLKQCYQELDKLEYSEENIAELFSIANKIIKFLKSKKNNQIKNHALHFVLLTKDREFKRFKDKQLTNMEDNFDEAKSNLISDLTMYCREFWDPGKDPPWDK
jgi:hypothetical protein